MENTKIIFPKGTKLNHCEFSETGDSLEVTLSYVGPVDIPSGDRSMDDEWPQFEWFRYSETHRSKNVFRLTKMGNPWPAFVESEEELHEQIKDHPERVYFVASPYRVRGV